jgi:sulfonate transport system substrate-binding protein
MRSRYFRPAIVITLVVLATLAAPQVRAEDGSKPTTVRLGIINAASSATLWAFSDIGAKYNLQFQEVTFQRYADARTALAAGDIDASNIGPQDIALALNQGAKGIIAVAGTASGGNCMAVRKGVTINDWQALRGKTIGIGAGSISWLMFAASVAENNIDYNALKTVNVIGSGMTFTKAMEDEQIDMMVAWQPFCAQAVLGGYGDYPGINHHDSKAVDDMDGIFVTTRAFMTAHPEATDRLVAAYVELVNRFQAHHDEWTKLYAEKTGIDPKLAAESVRNATLHYTFSADQMVRMAKFLFDSGIIQRDVSGELPQNIDYKPLMKATGKTQQELSEVAH